MSLFGRMFGSQNIMEKSLDTLTKTGDAMFFTDEEKSQYKINLLKAYESFKLVKNEISFPPPRPPSSERENKKITFSSSLRRQESNHRSGGISS